MRHVLAVGLAALAVVLGCGRSPDEAPAADPSWDRVAPPVPAKVIAQNESWGRWQRLRESNAPAAAQRAAARTVLDLALPAASLPRSDGSIPRSVLEVAGPGPYVERDTELAVLSHEWAYGMRRLFRVIDGPAGETIMFSHLVALDIEGRAHLTDIVGDIEILRRGVHDGDIVSASVFELDPETLAMRAVDPISRIPAGDANFAIAAFEPPIAVAEVPCRECHADDHINGRPSLPDDGDPSRRRRELLATHPALTATPSDPIAFPLAELLEMAS